MGTLRMKEMFGQSRPVVGVAHLPALPGSPEGGEGIGPVRERLLRDLEALEGVDGVLVENYGDAPYVPGRVPAHTVAFMSVLAADAVRAVDVPVGVNVLRSDGEAALSAAEAAGADFVRVNVWTGARVTDQGLVEGSAHRVARLRRRLGSRVRVFADVDVKHSAPLAPRSAAREAEEAAGRGRADAVVVTGPATGRPPEPDELEAVRRAAGVPVLAGSGVTVEGVAGVLERADGLVVGTALKRDGETSAPVDRRRVRRFLDAVEAARGDG